MVTNTLTVWVQGYPNYNESISFFMHMSNNGGICMLLFSFFKSGSFWRNKWIEICIFICLKIVFNPMINLCKLIYWWHKLERAYMGTPYDMSISCFQLISIIFPRQLRKTTYILYVKIDFILSFIVKSAELSCLSKHSHLVIIILTKFFLKDIVLIYMHITSF